MQFDTIYYNYCYFNLSSLKSNIIYCISLFKSYNYINLFIFDVYEVYNRT